MRKKRWAGVIILLSVLIILSLLFWFFFIFNTALPARLWEKAGNFYSEHGFSKSAANAFSRSIKNNPECDISIYYKASAANHDCGNYTKAEYYLSSAIQIYPQELDSYIRLSKLYIEEDKLLDAAKLTERVSSSVSSSLMSLRPAAPIIQPEERSSQDPVSVTLSFNGGSAYYSFGDDFPSVENRYESPLDLNYGITKVTAVVVGDSGLVSSVSEAVYTVRGDVSPLEIEDAKMDECIREAISVGRYDDLTTDMLWDIAELILPEGAEDYSVLQNCLSLQKLKVLGAEFDFSLLQNMKELRSLDLSGLTLDQEALSQISLVTSLEELNLSSCGLTDISPLAALSDLETLDLSSNQIEDLAPLSGMVSLQHLDISENRINSLSILTAIPGIIYFDGHGNRFGNLGAFSSNTVLEYLNVANCGVSDLSPLENNSSLKELHAENNAISSVESIAKCGSLTVLNLSRNRITEAGSISKLSNLSELYLNGNKLEELPSFSAISGLLILDISDNEIADLSVLKGLNRLHTLSMNSTLVTELSSVADLPNLVTINAEECEIHDPESATKRSIILNYDPTFELPEKEEDEESNSEE